ncbi:MAG TPA: ABC transporter permease [Bryobacteraceae bacterium]|jgi:predicted permease
MWNDFRLAARALRKSLIFSIAAIGTLSLGIAATTAIFSLYYQVLLRSLPVRAPEQLILLYSPDPGLPGWRSSDSAETVFSEPMYRSLRDGASRVIALAARSSATVEITRPSGSDRAQAEVVSGNFFSVVGVSPGMGRFFSPEEDRVPGRDPVAVLSFSYWIEHFGGDAGVINRKITINGHPFTIIGVVPRSFNGFLAGQNPALYVPIAMKSEISPGWDGFGKPGVHWLTIFGRPQPGVSRDRALASLRPVWTATLHQHVVEIVKRASARERLFAKPLDFHPAAQGINSMEKEWRKPLTVLLAMVALLLAIACANVANLLMGRAMLRSRELAVRVAVGASRWQVIRQSLAESLVLACAGGVAGTALSFAMVRGLIAVLPEDFSGHWLSVRPDAAVLGFSLLLVAITTLLFGVFPSIQAARVDPMSALKDPAGSASGSQARWRQALVAAQLAVSLALLIGAGLFAKTLINLLAHDPGFRPERLLTFSIDPQLSGYSLDRGRALYRDLERRLAALPGIESVAIAEFSPLSHSESSTNVTVEGYTPRQDDDANSDTNAISAGFFRTIGTPIVAGREFTSADRDGVPKVVVVNQAFARHFLAGRSAIGKRMKVGAGSEPLNLEIIGMVKDADNLSLRETVKPMYYLPLEQNNERVTRIRSACFFLRSRVDLQPLEHGVRAAVRAIDPDLPVFNVLSMMQRIDEAVYTDRLSAVLAVAFGILAMLLAGVGLYGVVAYSVARRTVEIGIRLAIGASPSQVLALVMKEVALLVVAGIVVGVPLAYALTRLMSSQLYGVAPESVGIFSASVAVIAILAAFSGLIPAARASTIDPKQALRYE